MPIGQSHLMVVFQRVGLIIKSSLGSKRGFLIKFLKDRDDRVSNPKPKNGMSTSSLTKKTTCGECGKNYNGD